MASEFSDGISELSDDFSDISEGVCGSSTWPYGERPVEWRGNKGVATRCVAEGRGRLKEGSALLVFSEARK
jgi:hypothetical protein